MIVPRAQVNLMLGGRKTVHRVPVTKIVPTGRSISVRPHHTGPASCRIIVTGMERQRLADVTGIQALEEGHKSLEDFKADWITRNEPAWMRVQFTYLEREGVSDEDAAETVRALAIHRFDTVHGPREAWVLRFTLDREERPRFLAARSEELYVQSPSRAMAGEPEALDELEQARQAKASSEAWAQERARRIAEREGWPLERRLAVAQREARGNPTASKRFRLIERQIAAIEHDLHQQPGEAA